MLTTTDLIKKLDCKLITQENGREICGGYCGDLLSVVMSHAQPGQAWITVMGNVNAAAVALLTDVACIILAENTVADEDMLQKARGQDIAVFTTPLPVYECAVLLEKLLRS